MYTVSSQTDEICKPKLKLNTSTKCKATLFPWCM